jgi:hypothetical protein
MKNPIKLILKEEMEIFYKLRRILRTGKETHE